MSNILQNIFQDYYEEMIYTLHPRQSVIENVDRIINCGDPAFGSAMYGCSFCGTLKFVPFRCHSRFCPTCGTKYSINRTTSMSFKILNVQHRHCLISEVGIDDSFKKTKAACYRNHKNSFYVYAKPNKYGPKFVAKYIGRYLGRPVIATSCIDNYDGESVTFHYNRHEDNPYVEETIPSLEFIERLIQHIPEKHFKQIRYYGIYARRQKNDEKITRAISKEKHSILLSFNRWHGCTLLSFGYDPLQCPCCGQKMLFLELYHNHQHVSLNELYERAMQKQRTEELRYLLICIFNFLRPLMWAFFNSKVLPKGELSYKD